MSDKKPKSKAKEKSGKASKKDVTAKDEPSKSKSKPKAEKTTSKELKKDTSKKSIKSIPQEEEKVPMTPPSQFAPEEAQTHLLSEREKCEGCFQGIGYCFCSQCGRIYCKICDDQMHMVPAFKSHDRVSLDQVSYLKQMCYHHGEPLKFFCESCKEPVCNQCQIIGPHNNKLHKIASIIEAFRAKCKMMNETIDKHITTKADKIEGAMQLIESALLETKDISTTMQKGIMKEYDMINESLTKAEGKKHAVLNYNSSLIQTKLKAIAEILSVFDQYNTGSNGGNGIGIGMMQRSDDAITFLLQFKSLQETIDHLVTVPIPEIKEDEGLYAWPKDLELTKEKLTQYDSMIKTLKVKNDIIWHMITNKSHQENEELVLLKQKTEKEINEWSKLTDKYANELKKYNKVCGFCGCYLDSNTMNSYCEVNNHQGFDKNNNYINHKPPETVSGTNMHYFAVPTEAYEEKTKGKLAESKQSLFSSSNPFERNLLNSSGKTPHNNLRYEETLSSNMTYTWVNKIAAAITKDKINLYELLCDYDLRNNGHISVDDLTCAMQKINVNLDQREYDSISQYFHMSGMNQIDIKMFSSNFS